ncbi:hypothetical protein [Laspinema olomoucense]|uniref:hypothetical protein n=1 Tax=Laspinema olomoucense TaxID=3231600 RepID=UPI0021BB25D1|nr:hypothetical protein [Laspinema sp. D3c]MCT7997181.1 hypothetical protein [Laspinema sp. D3c]
MQIHKAWTEVENQSLVLDYANLSRSQLEAKYGRSLPAIKAQALKLGAKRQRTYPSSTSKYALSLSKKKICQLYQSGLNSYEIAEQCFCSATNIQAILKRSGIVLRGSAEAARKYSLNEICFDTWTARSAYFVGLLMADGYNNETTSTIDLTLKSTDVDILIKFQSFLDTNRPLQPIPQNGQIRISINSSHISKRLAKIGVIQAKTHCCQFPDLPDLFIPDFMRGYFDGDGGLTQSQRIPSNVGFNVTGNIDLISRYQEELIQRCGLSKTKLYIRKKETLNIVSLRYSGRSNLLKIYRLLYECHSLSMDRKYTQFSKILGL